SEAPCVLKPPAGARRVRSLSALPGWRVGSQQAAGEPLLPFPSVTTRFGGGAGENLSVTPRPRGAPGPAVGNDADRMRQVEASPPSSRQRTTGLGPTCASVSGRAEQAPARATGFNRTFRSPPSEHAGRADRAGAPGRPYQRVRPDVRTHERSERWERRATR